MKRRQANRALAAALRPQRRLGSGQLVPRQQLLHSPFDSVGHRLDLVQMDLWLRLAVRHDELGKRRL